MWAESRWSRSSLFGRGVGIEAEQVVEATLGLVGLGEHAPGPGPSPLALVEQDRLFDAGQGVEESAHAEVNPAPVGPRTMRRAAMRASTQVKTCALILWSVKWYMGEKETTLGSLIWRKSPSACSWEQ